MIGGKVIKEETKKFFTDMIDELDELKFRKRELEQQLTRELLDCKLSIRDALIIGIVRPGFATPTHFRRDLWNMRGEHRDTN